MDLKYPEWMWISNSFNLTLHDSITSRGWPISILTAFKIDSPTETDAATGAPATEEEKVAVPVVEGGEEDAGGAEEDNGDGEDEAGDEEREDCDGRFLDWGIGWAGDGDEDEATACWEGDTFCADDADADTDGRCERDVDDVDAGGDDVGWFGSGYANFNLSMNSTSRALASAVPLPLNFGKVCFL